MTPAHADLHDSPPQRSVNHSCVHVRSYGRMKGHREDIIVPDRPPDRRIPHEYTITSLPVEAGYLRNQR